MNKTIFKRGDFVLPDGANEILEEDGYLPSKKISRDIFKEGPLPVKLIIDVTCTCGTAGSHPPWCAISLNSGHTQILVLACRDKSQVQCSGAKYKIIVPPPPI